MDRCQIFGEIDLRALPENLEKLILKRNDVSGPIHLTRLPPHMRVIDLYMNDITMIYVHNIRLPKSLEICNAGNKNLQLKIRISSIDGIKNIDNRIFADNKELPKKFAGGFDGY
eukprot:CAMPEP_0201532710 /NCGR_PEP_ID=MMETSP0161_2-20130828/51136_1 /ASSEMBLY_ACC=CAM_ASM_000251 /TAXON_ID=180227 /ORGANISM="Neoparamoeba aestuarina, Strain SoJaBio B1-5/56/2" /LENGTH=113 /DNA_ID=CAMNT_0047936281 /DNA_START=402 /DNA_END=743 /DNA_ORIENTATION=+